MLGRFRAALGRDAFDVVDHWPSDVMAIGIASPRNHQVLVYMHVSDDGYYAELELPPAASVDSLYEVAGQHSGIGFERLVEVVVEHFQLAR